MVFKLFGSIVSELSAASRGIHIHELTSVGSHKNLLVLGSRLYVSRGTGTAEQLPACCSRH